MRVDLHIHSIFSDSSRSPEEIVDLAKSRKINLISICDHYSIDGYEHLEKACKQNNIIPVLGVELDANWNNNNSHVLVYNFDRNNSEICEFIRKQHEKSDLECENIIRNMAKDYPQMSVEDYRTFKMPEGIGGWKYIHYIVSKGIEKTYEEASYYFGKYFEPDSHTFELDKFCELVKRAGGVPILAHPGYIYTNNPNEFVNVLNFMVESGILGIECYYPSHSKEIVDSCVAFCKRNNLRITCGCDCHGKYDLREGFTIGYLDISKDMLDLRGIV